MRRRLDNADTRKLRKGRWGDIRPLFAAIAGHKYEAIVRAGPDGLRIKSRWRNGEDRAVDLGAILIFGDRAAGIAERIGIGAREIRTDAIPVLARISGSP